MTKAEEARRRRLIARARGQLSSSSPEWLHRLAAVLERLLAQPELDEEAFSELETLLRGRGPRRPAG